MIERYIKRSKRRALVIIRNDSPAPVVGTGAVFGRISEQADGQRIHIVESVSLELTPALRTCNVCGHQAAKGAGTEGDLCPLLACPGQLQ